MSKKKISYSKWTQVDGLGICSVIGDEDRFSISIRLEEMTVGINGCRIVDGKHGRFISFPAWKDSKGMYHDYTFLAFNNKEDADKIVEMF